MLTIINPPSPPGSVSNKDTMGGLGQLYPADSRVRMPPIDIPYAAAVLRERGIPFDVVDCLGSSMDTVMLLDALRKRDAGLTAIRTSLPSFDWDLRVAELVSVVTGSKILLFGPCMEHLYDSALNCASVDAVLVGEPDNALAEICEKGLDTHPSVICKNNPSGSAWRKSQVDDLDMLPFPAWDTLPYLNYSGEELMRGLTPFVTVLTSRGCPHGCIYCPYPTVQGRTIRMRSEESVLHELEWLERRLGVRAVMFRDPEFAISRSRVEHLCEGMLNASLKIAWRCETRMENLDDGLIELMARAGCIGINMGVESADEDVLRSINRRPISMEHAFSVMESARKNAVDTFCFFILGLPGESWQSALRTIDLARKLRPDAAQFTVATPYPGTQLHDRVIREGLFESGRLDILTGYQPVMRTEHLSIEDLGTLQEYAVLAWNMRGLAPLGRLARLGRRAGGEMLAWLRYFRRKSEMQRLATLGPGGT